MKFARKVKNKLGKVVEVLCDPSDSTPVEVPANMKRPESQDERIRRIIREQIRPQDAGYETEEEANDLEIPDDEDFTELPMTFEEMEYLKSRHSDIIEEVLEARKNKPEKEVIEDAREDTEDGSNTDDTVSDSEG